MTCTMVSTPLDASSTFAQWLMILLLHVGGVVKMATSCYYDGRRRLLKVSKSQLQKCDYSAAAGEKLAGDL